MFATTTTSSKSESYASSCTSMEDTHHERLAAGLEARVNGINFRTELSIEKLYSFGNEVVPSENPSSNKAVIFAAQLSNNKTVVIKWRSKSRSFKDETEIEDWVLHMRILYQISHSKDSSKHVAKVLDIIEDMENYYVVMEYVRGRDLFDYFVQDKVYEKSYKLDVVRQIAYDLIKGLQEFHALGLVHKDIKLENIVLDESEKAQTGPDLYCTCKIVDFDTVEVYRPGFTSFHVLGTDQYIAPETYSGNSTPGSDMWSIGVIFFTILTGQFPFHYALFDDQPGENYVGHPRMDQIRRRLRIARLDWSNKVWTVDPRGKDFLRRCFCCDINRRMTVDEALEHPWLKELGKGKLNY